MSNQSISRISKYYNDYPIYPQLWGDFEHSLSILDLLFNCGAKSFEYMLNTQS